jgi:hypothetical protein
MEGEQKERKGKTEDRILTALPLIHALTFVLHTVGLHKIF